MGPSLSKTQKILSGDGSEQTMLLSRQPISWAMQIISCASALFKWLQQLKLHNSSHAVK